MEIPARVRAVLDAGGERFGELALLAGFALIRAYNRYADRREQKRPGRRASDVSLESLKRSIARCERVTAELGARLSALERKRA